MSSLEEDLFRLDEKISSLSNESQVPNEWSIINDMHSIVEELRFLLKEYRQRQERNLRMKE